jgi:hypothetical protein
MINGVYGITVLFLIFILMPVAIILSVAYAIKYVKHEHEWEKVIDTCDKGGCGKVVIYRCKSCGKKKRYKA